jgi:predicted acetyltransferase
LGRIILRDLKISDEEQFMLAFNADWESNFDFAHYWKSLALCDYQRFIKIVPEFREGKHIPKEHVPCSFLFAFNENGEIVGRTSIRHELTDFLLKAGGHIGYGVVPKFRRKGYATEILKESLIYISKNLPSLTSVLITCDKENIGSNKTIQKNKGVLENVIELPNSANKMRYWIQIK